MQIRLSPEHEAAIERNVASGRYESAEAYILDAIETLRERDEWRAEELARLDASIAEAERGELIDEDEVRRRLSVMHDQRTARQTA